MQMNPSLLNIFQHYFPFFNLIVNIQSRSPEVIHILEQFHDVIVPFNFNCELYFLTWKAS